MTKYLIVQKYLRKRIKELGMVAQWHNETGKHNTATNLETEIEEIKQLILFLKTLNK